MEQRQILAKEMFKSISNGQGLENCLQLAPDALRLHNPAYFDRTFKLIINQGTVVEDGARIAPSSSFEVSGAPGGPCASQEIRADSTEAPKQLPHRPSPD